MVEQSLAVHSMKNGTTDSMGRPRRQRDPWVWLFRNTRKGLPERPIDWREGDPVPEEIRKEYL